jgi:hypothetical protein
MLVVAGAAGIVKVPSGENSRDRRAGKAHQQDAAFPA